MCTCFADHSAAGFWYLENRRFPTSPQDRGFCEIQQDLRSCATRPEGKSAARFPRLAARQREHALVSPGRRASRRLSWESRTSLQPNHVLQISRVFHVVSALLKHRDQETERTYYRRRTVMGPIMVGDPILASQRSREPIYDHLIKYFHRQGDTVQHILYVLLSLKPVTRLADFRTVGGLADPIRTSRQSPVSWPSRLPRRYLYVTCGSPS